MTHKNLYNIEQDRSFRLAQKRPQSKRLKALCVKQCEITGCTEPPCEKIIFQLLEGLKVKEKKVKEKKVKEIDCYGNFVYW